MTIFSDNRTRHLNNSRRSASFLPCEKQCQFHWGLEVSWLSIIHETLKQAQVTKYVFFRKTRAFTLVELLVAIAIFSLLISIITFSFVQSGNIIKHLDFSYSDDFRKIERLRDSIGSIFFYVAQDNKFGKAEEKFFKYFYGERDKLRYVTNLDFKGKKRLVLHEISQERNQIILKEEPIFSGNANYLNPEFTDNVKQYVLFKDVEDFVVNYFADGVEKTSIKENYPSLIYILVTQQGERYEYIFDVKENNSDIEQIYEEMYEPF